MHPVIQDKQPELESLCQRFHVARLDLFGSGLSDRFDVVDSDLDFLVEFGPLPEGSHADHYFGLKSALESLFERPVDLVMESAIRNPYFRREMERTGRTIC